MTWKQTLNDYVNGHEHMKRYVSTVILNESLSKALVIRKDHGPINLIGKLTSIGGHIEPGESLFAAAVREIAEEAGLVIEKHALTFIGNLSDTAYTWDVAYFMVVLTDVDLGKAQSLTSEKVELWNVADLLISVDHDIDNNHMLYEALRAASRKALYDGSRGIRFSVN